MTTVAERLTPVRADPAGVAVVLDYDGTLSPIVADAADALPQEGVAELLARLRDRVGLVAVVSGRPIDFLAPLLPPGLVLAGLYGLELAVDDQRLDHPQSGNWREVIDDVAGRAEIRGPVGVGVERKGLSLTLHYRAVPEQEAATEAYAADEALRSGLVA
ncbi:MAG: trehalose-phosphatase, partial [Acidimicrobiales bacterium]